VSGGILFGEAHVTYCCPRSVESGLPLTAMQTLYNGVETVNAASATAIYPLTMQLVVSHIRFANDPSLKRAPLGN
jgi:hypothetical protein